MKDPQYFDLDKNSLDSEWCSQVRLYHDAAERLADARRDWEHAKTQAEIACAEVAKEVRDYPMKYGLEKVTESAVKEAVTLSRKVRDAELAVVDARHAFDICEVEVQTLDHRKKALENLVQLRLADYFSEPKLPNRNGREEKDRMERRSAFKARKRNGKSKGRKHVIAVGMEPGDL